MFLMKQLTMKLKNRFGEKVKKDIIFPQGSNNIF